MILLHGLSYDRSQWGPLIGELDAEDPGLRRGIATPVVVGHSLGGALATVYAAAHPAAAVVNIDQPLLAGPFRDVLLRAEPALRSPAYGEVGETVLQGMRIDLLPPAARELVRTATAPRQDLLLG